MIDSIQTFGDSFLFGSDLSDSDSKLSYSKLTWPAITAEKLDLVYKCRAEGGRGNQAIAFQIFKRATRTSLNIINWTWADRFDYHFNLEPATGWPNTIRPIGDEISKFYYKHLHSDIDDKIKNLTIVHSAIKYLQENDFPYIMTYMDHSMVESFDKRLELLREEVCSNLQTFPNNQTFLEWSRANGYPESDNWHPLEEAHEKAAEYWLPIYQRAINTHTATTKD